MIDLGLPGYSDIEALIAFRKAFPVVPAVVISAVEDSPSVQAALHAGAAGYIPKTSMPAVMIGALKLIASGGIYLPPQAIPAVTKKKFGGSNSPALTERQADTLRLLMKGLSNRAIGRQLRISEHTVKQHVHAAFKALGVASRTEAFVVLTRLGVKLD